jgi:lysozyme
MEMNIDSNMSKGFDISHWQKEIDWPAVTNHNTIKFVMAKATEGATWQDPNFSSYWQAMKQQGVLITGAYHYFRGTSLPASQANNIMTQLKQVGFNHSCDLLAISVAQQDKLNPSEVANNLRWLIGNLTSPVIQQRVILYASPHWWNNHVQDVGHRLSQQPLWVAHWTTAEQPQLPDGWDDWMIWQHSCTGSVEGIKGDVCLDKMKTTQAVTNDSNPSFMDYVTSLKNHVNTLLSPSTDHELDTLLNQGRKLMNHAEQLTQSLASITSATPQHFSHVPSGHPLTHTVALSINQSLPALANG